MSRCLHSYPYVLSAGALLLGCVIYLCARPFSLFYIGGDVSIPLIGQLPTFLHTLAFALASAIIVSRHEYAAIWSWGAIEALAELAQHELFPAAGMLLSYRESSTFDPLDLLSILVALWIAILVKNNAGYR